MGEAPEIHKTPTIIITITKGVFPLHMPQKSAVRAQLGVQNTVAVPILPSQPFT